MVGCVVRPPAIGAVGAEAAWVAIAARPDGSVRIATRARAPGAAPTIGKRYVAGVSASTIPPTTGNELIDGANLLVGVAATPMGAIAVSKQHPAMHEVN